MGPLRFAGSPRGDRMDGVGSSPPLPLAGDDVGAVDIRAAQRVGVRGLLVMAARVCSIFVPPDSCRLPTAYSDGGKTQNSLPSGSARTAQVASGMLPNG